VTPVEFRDLKRHWYALLRESGFRDLEEADGSLRDRWHHNRAVKTPVLVREAVVSYFDAVGSYLHHGEFDSAVDRQIWELHGEGWTNPEIGELVGLCKESVRLRVRKYLGRMRALKGSIAGRVDAER